MSDFFVAVGCAEFNGSGHVVELRVGTRVSADVYHISPIRARRLARKLYWAARMVDSLVKDQPQPKEPVK